MNVDYAFYADQFHGKKIGAEDWSRFELKAKYYINAITSGRAEHSNSIDVKYAVCSAAETIAECEENGSVVSERVGNVSVTYDTDKNLRQKILDNAMIFLVNSGLLYRGVKLC